MEDPKGLIEFLQTYSNEKTCIDQLVKDRWGAEVTCPLCGTINTKLYTLASGKLKCASCRQTFSARVGTIFEDSKIHLQKWFLAIYLATSLKKGISSVQVSKYLGITQKSAWFMLQRIRHAIFSDDSRDLEGEVEIDETYIGGKVSNHTNKKEELKEVVFGMVERDGEVRIKHVKSSGFRTLMPEIEKTIAAGNTIYSDQWRAYMSLNRRGYNHQTVNHGNKEYVVGKIYTQNIENIWSQLKRSIYGVYHQVSPKHLQLYCNEVEYRYNTRKLSDLQRFHRWFGLIVGKRLEYKDLTR